MYVPLAMYSFRMSFESSRPESCEPRRSFLPPLCTLRAEPWRERWMVIDVVTFPRSIPPKRVSMSGCCRSPRRFSRLHPLQRRIGIEPHLRRKVKSHDRPVCPELMRKWYRRFVSSASPNPAYWRMVQCLPRYMVEYTPRVNGYCPASRCLLRSRFLLHHRASRRRRNQIPTCFSAI